MVPFASFEKFSNGGDDEDAWLSESAFGTEVEYALSSNVTLGAGVERSVTKWDGAAGEDEEVKATKGFFNVKVAF